MKFGENLLLSAISKKMIKLILLLFSLDLMLKLVLLFLQKLMYEKTKKMKMELDLEICLYSMISHVITNETMLKEL